jgi:hypothetical protein
VSRATFDAKEQFTVRRSGADCPEAHFFENREEWGTPSWVESRLKTTCLILPAREIWATRQPERRHEDFLKANEALMHFPEPRSQRAK